MDPEFLLHVLRLNYIRHVLPSHAPQSQLPGTGPHNLIAFDLTALDSPYIQLAGLANEDMWPELLSGRESPPLGLAANRRERRADATAGGAPLNYSKTIGRKGEEAVPRLGRRRGNSAAGGSGSKEEAATVVVAIANADETLPVEGVINRRRSMEKDLHRRRIASSSNNVLSGLPPVIVHSPVRTPVDGHGLLRQSTDSSETFDVPPSPGFEGEEEEDDDEDDDDDEEEEDDLAQSPQSEYALSPRPLSQISEKMERSDSQPSSSSPVTPNIQRRSTFPSNGSISSLVRPSSMVSSSSASSISDTEDHMHSERRGSEISLVVPASPAAIAVQGLGLGLGLPTRPRRRVNISGRSLLPVAVAASDTVLDGIDLPTKLPRNSSEGDLLAVPLRRLSTRSSTKPTNSSNAAPSLRSPLSKSAPAMPAPAIINVVTTHSAAALASPARSPHRHPSISFAKVSLASARPPPPTRSALTDLMATLSEPTTTANPFATFYGALSSKASDALSLSIFFPHSKEPRKKVDIAVKKDLSVEEVIGAGLWAYFDQSREPPIELVEGEEERETTKWNLRIVEDDGEVDEDFPALDRGRAISAFSFGEFAIVQANSNQIKENLVKQSKIRRRPSRILARSKTQQSTPMLPSASRIAATNANAANTSIVVLRILLPQIAGLDGLTTTLNVASDMNITDVVDGICAKRGIENPREWVLKSIEAEGMEPVLLAPESTVESLGDNLDLSLVRRRNLGDISVANNATVNYGGNLDPETSLLTTYRRYSVYRKLPMPLGRHLRTIALDVDYVHFLPAENRGMFDAGKTVSYHIGAIVECRVSKRSKGSFKILVQKDRRVKRYDFEGENARQTAEIVHHVNVMIKFYKEEQTSSSLRRW